MQHVTHLAIGWKTIGVDAKSHGGNLGVEVVDDPAERATLLEGHIQRFTAFGILRQHFPTGEAIAETGPIIRFGGLTQKTRGTLALDGVAQSERSHRSGGALHHPLVP